VFDVDVHGVQYSRHCLVRIEKNNKHTKTKRTVKKKKNVVSTEIMIFLSENNKSLKYDYATKKRTLGACT